MFSLRKLSDLRVQKYENVKNSSAMDLQIQKSKNNSTGNVLYNKMKRQYAQLKQAHREKQLQKLQRFQDPYMQLPKNQSLRRKQPEILEPLDKFRKNLPPVYQRDLESSYRNLLGEAVSRTHVFLGTSSNNSSE